MDSLLDIYFQNAFNLYSLGYHNLYVNNWFYSAWIFTLKVNAWNNYGRRISLNLMIGILFCWVFSHFICISWLMLSKTVNAQMAAIIYFIETFFFFSPFQSNGTSFWNEVNGFNWTKWFLVVLPKFNCSLGHKIKLKIKRFRWGFEFDVRVFRENLIGLELWLNFPHSE